jgi:hypothetical protein
MLSVSEWNCPPFATLWDSRSKEIDALWAQQVIDFGDEASQKII